MGQWVSGDFYLQNSNTFIYRDIYFVKPMKIIKMKICLLSLTLLPLPLLYQGDSLELNVDNGFWETFFSTLMANTLLS